MSSRSIPATLATACAVILAASLTGFVLASPDAVHAQAAKPPAAKVAPKPATPAPVPPGPTASHLALAREVMLASGIARSFDSIIPTFAEQIRKAAITRPELTGDLDEVLKALDPEMELQKQRMITTAAGIYAKTLTEAELQDVATFFRSPSGKRYVETQPQVLDGMVQAMQGWTEEVSEYMMVRVRAEMGKKGHQLQ